jgi:uncharacterized protein (DUF697 family)
MTMKVFVKVLAYAVLLLAVVFGIVVLPSQANKLIYVIAGVATSLVYIFLVEPVIDRLFSRR